MKLQRVGWFPIQSSKSLSLQCIFYFDYRGNLQSSFPGKACFLDNKCIEVWDFNGEACPASETPGLAGVICIQNMLEYGCLGFPKNPKIYTSHAYTSKLDVICIPDKANSTLIPCNLLNQCLVFFWLHQSHTSLSLTPCTMECTNAFPVCTVNYSSLWTTFLISYHQLPTFVNCSLRKCWSDNREHFVHLAVPMWPSW